jgi:GAF domain-containing protein
MAAGRLHVGKIRSYVPEAAVFLEGKPVQIPDVLADAEYKLIEGQKLGGWRALLAVPLLRDGQPMGVIVLVRMAPRPFTESQIELITTFADQAVIAIANTRLFEEVQARNRDLTALGEVGRAVSSTLDLETVLSTIVAKAVQLSGTEGGVIYVYDELEQTFQLRATYGLSEEMISAIRSSTSARQMPSARRSEAENRIRSPTCATRRRARCARSRCGPGIARG